ncbi:hypothetical protein OPT61_g5810 [Boeremia exigua]|uniref:Uncharacterized protein n=1 Tax=Boeremia exigua TaxID=749465 RepID=A0ACC2I8X4_9PLEO|nr:hypothetical protein OPT61_g5810 [Boeremia exigua]
MYTSRTLLSNLASCLSLAAVVASLPTNGQDFSISKRNATIEQSVFYDIGGTELEEKIAKLKAEGYQPTSLSVHGSPTDAKYAGIWTKENGNAYETILGANETTYNAWLDQWRASGYVSTHVSATGSDSDAVFAGVVQEMPSVSNWVQACGLAFYYDYFNATMNVPMIIKGVSMYGSPSKRQYCILGHEDTVNYQQTISYQTQWFTEDYKIREAAETSKPHWRPVYIDVSEDQLHTPIFDDSSIGEWVALTDLTSSQLDTEISAQRAKNLHPVHIAGGGDAEAKYAVIFVERTAPLEREWHTTGTVTGFRDNAEVSNALDQVMQTFMKRNSIRQAQVAASVDGKVVASRAFTWAESDRAVAQPSDKFMLASVSKMFTHAATNHLVSTGLLNLTTLVYPLLGYSKPADERALDITVQHLLDHTAGYDRTKTPDLGFIFRDVAKSLNQATPATLRQVIEHVVAQPLDFTPGEDLVYSNYGTMLLSYVVTNLTGETYASFLEKYVDFGADVEVWSTAADTHKSDSIVQETKFVAASALTPLSDDQVSQAFGGDGSIKEEVIGSFGMKGSAETISRFIGTNAVYGIGGREPYSYRDGSIAGARTFAQSLPQLDWALTLNSREYLNERAWEDLIFTDVQGVWNRFSLAE